MRCQFSEKTESYIEHAEAWKLDHFEVMAKYEDADKLSSEIAGAVECYESFLQLQINAPITIGMSKSLSGFQVAWYDYATMLASMVDSLQNDDYKVAGTAVLHQKLSDVSQYISQLKLHLESLEVFELGDEIPVQG